jgi:hypothetical protein
MAHADEDIWPSQPSITLRAIRYRAFPFPWAFRPVLAERLFVGSGREMGLKLATMKDGSPVIAVPVASDVIDFLLSNAIDALLIDPFISCHSVKENDNDAMDTVVKEWGRIAGAANCAIGLVSHARKPMNGSARENTTAVLT